MARNLISNGNFETGNFNHWIVTEGDGKAKVVEHKGSYKAEFKPGKRQSTGIDTRFKAGPGDYTLSFNASIPDSTIPEGSSKLDTPPLVLYLIIGWNSAEPMPIHVSVHADYLTRDKKLIQYSATMFPNVDEVQVQIAVSNRLDPAEMGPLYIDNVKYVAELPQ